MCNSGFQYRPSGPLAGWLVAGEVAWSRRPRLLLWVGESARSTQVENELEGVLDGAQLGEGEMADGFAECASVNGANHFAEDLSRFVTDRDLGVEARGWRRS